MNFLTPLLSTATRSPRKLSFLKSREELLRESILGNDLKQVSSLLDKDEDIVNRDLSENDSHPEHHGYAAIHYVCEFNTQADILQSLLRHKASVNLRINNEDERSTPLHIAVRYSKSDLVRCLLEHQANPNETDFLGETVLMKAAVRGDLTILSLLLDYRANLNTLDFRGQTALMMAVKSGQAAVVKVLLSQSELLVNCQDNMGWTALMKAVSLHQGEIVSLLLNHPSLDLDLLNQTGETALMLATSKGYARIVSQLVERAMSPQANETALDLLLRHRSLNPLIREQIRQILLLSSTTTEEEVENNDDNNSRSKGKP